jgi:hypothetical protein
MGWLAVPAGLAFGLAALISALSVRRNPGRSTPPTPAGALASLVFAILALPAMLAAAAAVHGGAIVEAATVVCAAGVVGIGLDAAMRLFRSRVPVGVERRVRYLFPVGFLAFHLWVTILSVAILIGGALPAGLGWLGIITIGAFVAGTVGSVLMPEDRWGVGRSWFVGAYAPQAGVAVWMVWLGLSL